MFLPLLLILSGSNDAVYNTMHGVPKVVYTYRHDGWVDPPTQTTVALRFFAASNPEHLIRCLDKTSATAFFEKEYMHSTTSLWQHGEEPGLLPMQLLKLLVLNATGGVWVELPSNNNDTTLHQRIPNIEQWLASSGSAVSR